MLLPYRQRVKCSWSVSYTHLDVYKRQNQGDSGSGKDGIEQFCNGTFGHPLKRGNHAEEEAQDVYKRQTILRVRLF